VTTEASGSKRKGVAGIVESGIPESREALNALGAAFFADTENAIVTFSLDGVITGWNKGAEKIYGYAPEEAVGQPLSLAVPVGADDEQTKLVDRLRAEQVIGRHERVVRGKEGREVVISTTFSPIRSASGETVSAVMMGHNITDRKRAEGTLARKHVATQRLARTREDQVDEVKREIQTILESVPIVLFLIEPDGWISHMAGSGVEGLPGQPEEYRNQIGLQCVVEEEFKRAMQGYQVRFQITLENGKKYEVTYSPRRDRGGQVIGITGVGMDVTERHREEELRAVLERLCFEIADAPDLDRALNILIMRICSVIGCAYGGAWLPDPGAEYLTCSTAFWCADDARQKLDRFRKFTEGLQFPMGTGLPGRVWESKEAEWIQDLSSLPSKLYKRKELAEEVGFQSAMAVPVVSNGNVLAVLVFFLTTPTDLDEKTYHWIQSAVTQLAQFLRRKEAEEASLSYQRRLRSLAVELGHAELKERQRIAKGLHDGVGQSLALARIKLGALKKRFAPQVREHVEDIERLIEKSDEETRTLTFDLSPPVLYQLGLEPALEWLAEKFEKDYGLKCKMQRGSEPPLQKDPVRTTLFLAMRELMYNVVKHADAKEVAILIHRANDLMRIDVEDDGKGFDVNKLQQDAVSSEENKFGLFNIEERINYLGGRLELRSQPGEGTKVTLIAPMS